VENRAQQERLRQQHAERVRRPLLPIPAARSRGPKLSHDGLTVPPFTGTRLVEPMLDELVPYIDWQFFFHAWDLKGKFPAILDNPAAQELYDDALAVLTEIRRESALRAQGVYGFWPAQREEDDVVVGDGDTRFCFLRQQTDHGDDRPNICLADYFAPAGDTLGAFAVGVHGADEFAAHYAKEHDDYRAIIVKALADRLAEAFAERLHEQARREWYAPGEQLSPDELRRESFRGIRPAFGYPACPDHSEKPKLFALLGAERVGLDLTESFAMTPAAAVSGIYLAHPAAKYFTVGRIGRDQLEDYAARKGIAVAEAERWLTPNLS
jgi:5-methyltetrahydrofolate--homocysteine methyltransferase